MNFSKGKSRCRMSRGCPRTRKKDRQPKSRARHHLLKMTQLAYSAEMCLAGLAGIVRSTKASHEAGFWFWCWRCVSAAVNVLLIVKQPTPRHFAATPDPRLAPLVLGQAPADTTGPFELVTETICNAVSLDFLEWREKLSNTRENLRTRPSNPFWPRWNHPAFWT